MKFLRSYPQHRQPDAYPHISQCRHVGDDIILLMTAEVFLQIHGLLPLATLILFRVLPDEILLYYLF